MYRIRLFPLREWDQEKLCYTWKYRLLARDYIEFFFRDRSSVNI